MLASNLHDMFLKFDLVLVIPDSPDEAVEMSS